MYILLLEYDIGANTGGRFFGPLCTILENKKKTGEPRDMHSLLQLQHRHINVHSWWRPLTIMNKNNIKNSTIRKRLLFIANSTFDSDLENLFSNAHSHNGKYLFY